MRACIFVLLLAVMTFQSAWASAAVYCQHDADLSTRHVGHHDHRHASASVVPADGTTAPNQTSSGSIDNDCGFCHLSCAQPMVAAAVAPALLIATPPLVPSSTRLYASRDRERIDRPNWRWLVRSASLEELHIT